MALARRIAETHMQLERARRARHELLSDALADIDFRSRKQMKLHHKAVNLLCRNLKHRVPSSPELINYLYDFMQPIPPSDEKLATLLYDLTPELERIGRYEQRAHARRKLIRQFDATSLCVTR